MEVHFTPEQEAQLVQLATDAGTDAERLVKDVILRILLEAKGRRYPAAPTLPVWHLGVLGTLRRQEIYDDDAR